MCFCAFYLFCLAAGLCFRPAGRSVGGACINFTFVYVYISITPLQASPPFLEDQKNKIKMDAVFGVDFTTAVSLAVAGIFAYIILGDAVRWLQAALQKKNTAAVAAATTTTTTTTTTPPPPSTPATPETPTEPPAQKEAPIEKKEESTEPTKPSAPTPTPTPTPTPSATKADDLLDNLLDDAFDEADSVENVIDQAWDKVHAKDMQVSTNVSGLNDFIQNSVKALDEGMKRAEALKKEKKIEETREEQARGLKRQGNAAYEAKHYEKAVVLYSKAIRLLPDVDDDKHTLFSNRSAANYFRGFYNEALKDAESCIKLNPKFVKGQIRKGMALEKLSEWGEAKAHYESTVKKHPKDPSIKEAEEGIQRCETALDDLLFE